MSKSMSLKVHQILNNFKANNIDTWIKCKKSAVFCSLCHFACKRKRVAERQRHRERLKHRPWFWFCSFIRTSYPRCSVEKVFFLKIEFRQSLPQIKPWYLRSKMNKNRYQSFLVLTNCAWFLDIFYKFCPWL